MQRCMRVTGFPVLFHPDYDRRPRDHTGSTDLDEQTFAKRSRARCDSIRDAVAALPPVGIFTPPREHRDEQLRKLAPLFATRKFITIEKMLQSTR